MKFLKNLYNYVLEMKRKWDILSEKEQRRLVSKIAGILSVFIVLFIFFGLLFYQTFLAVITAIILILGLLIGAICFVWFCLKLIIGKIFGLDMDNW